MFARHLGITFILLAALYTNGQVAGIQEPKKGADHRQAARLQGVPLAFEKNIGQARAGTGYLARSGMIQAELSATEMQLSLPPIDKRGQMVSVHIEGARTDAEAITAEKLQGESNYLLGDNPSTWRTHVPTYERVTYRQIYRGIDVAYYGNGSQLEHDFIVHPGAAPSDIHLRFEGARNLKVTRTGDLQIALDRSIVTLRKPRAYQTIDGVRRDVPAQYSLAGGRVAFRLGSYDRKQPLIIDPVLDYSTFLGDASIYVTGMAVDAAGNTYITGEAPVAFPANANPATCSNCVSSTKLAVFVTKLNASGTAVIYSTFIGGSQSPYSTASNDQPSALTVDQAGNAIVTGSTSSTDFPLKNPISAGVPSFDDGFLVSLTPDGASLNFSSRLGGSSSGSTAAMVYPQSVAADAAGNVYVAGTSQSPYLPTTPGALQAMSPSYSNTGAFLLKLAPGGALVYGAVVGAIGSASGITGPTSLAVDDAGVVYMAGTAGQSYSTGATPWPTTPGAYQSSLISPSQNAPFVTRISADGSAILSSTLIGAGNVTSMVLTPTHDVLIAGSPGYNFPLTSDAYNTDVPAYVNGVPYIGAPAFFAKVSKDGTQLLYSSMFEAYVAAIGEDLNGNVWLAGTARSRLTNLVNPLQSVFSGYNSGGSGYVAEFDPAMHNLKFSTYVNSDTGFSQISSLALDSTGAAHVAGIASKDFPTTEGAPFRSVTPPPQYYTYTYGFAAVIDATKPGPSVCLKNVRYAPGTLVGSTANGSFDIMNCGDGPLTISSVQLASDVFALSSPNACVGVFAAGSSCTVAYTFTPKATGTVTATVLIASDAPMTKSISITGTGTAPKLDLPFGSSYSFAPQVLGVAGQTVYIMVTSSGTASLVVDTNRTTLTGPFSVVSTSCGVALPPSSACTYKIAFNPVTAGAASGALTLFSNDPVNPMVDISLSGTALASYPVPTIRQLDPPTVSLDGGVASVNIYGTNFFPASTVSVNGVSVPVQSSNNTGITVKVDPAILGALGEFPLQVTNPAPGGGNATAAVTAYHSLAVTATQIIYEPKSKMMYVAVPATASTNPNTIIPLNPATGVWGTPIPVEKNPNHLALSDDSHYLYVGFYSSYQAKGVVQRIDLNTGAVDRTFNLPGSSDGVMDMHVIPGSPQLLVASLARPASPAENGVALFNDAGLVQYISNDYSDHYYSLDNFTFTSDPTTFYGYPFNNTFFNTASVSASGIVPVSYSPYGSCCSQTSGSQIVSDGSLLYTNSGQVWDPKTKTLLGRYDSNLFYEPGIVADPVAKRTFILKTYGTSASYPAIASYDPSTFGFAGELSFKVPTSLVGLVRWGSNGFAFLANTSNYGDFVNPPSESQLVLVSSTLAAGGVPVFAVSPATLTFSSLPVGASAQKTLAVQNAGSVPVANIAVAVSGNSSAEFNAVSGCGTTLAPGMSCNVTVTFQPSAEGNKTANLTMSATGAASQTVALAGTASQADFVLASTGSGVATVTAGQSASFDFSVSQYGAFTGTVAMSCTSLPLYASCSFTPASFTAGSTPTQVALRISTKQSTQASAVPRARFSRLFGMFVLMFPVMMFRTRPRAPRAWLVLCLAVICAGMIMFSGCGGGGSGNISTSPTNLTTPSGTYIIKAVATSGSLSHSTNVSLVVQ